MFSQIVLCDRTASREHLLPLVATRPVGNLRVGILTLDVKWARVFQCQVSYWTVDYLADGFPLNRHLIGKILFLDAAVLPTTELVSIIAKLQKGERLVDTDNNWIATCAQVDEGFEPADQLCGTMVSFEQELKRIRYPEDIFIHNAEQLIFDLVYLKPTMMFEASSATNKVVGESLYIEHGANVHHAHLDSSLGPIYIAAGAEIEPQVVIKGPAAICANSRVKSGSRIYPNVTIGDSSTVCGELSHTVIWGYSAKSHEGYLGCAVVGEGCNLGAGTNNSNLRNDWQAVKLYDYSIDALRDTKLLKCGVIIGDQSMLGIQSKINTGTVIGVGTQIAISKFIPKFVPDFSWLTDSMNKVYDFESFILMLRRKALVKGEEVSAAMEEYYRAVFYTTHERRDKIINTKNK